MAVTKNSGISGTTVSYNTTNDDNGTYRLANQLNMYEIQRGNNFEFLVGTGINDMVAMTSNNLKLSDSGATDPYKVINYFGDGKKTETAQERIRLSVSSAFVPHFQQSVIQVRRGNSVLKYAGVPDFSNGSITLNDYIGTYTKEILMAWQNMSYNLRTEKVGLATDYKLDCKLMEYTPDYQLVRTWVLVGCWISNMQEGDYSSDSNDKHSVTITIEYDRAYIDTTEDTTATS